MMSGDLIKVIEQSLKEDVGAYSKDRLINLHYVVDACLDTVYEIDDIVEVSTKDTVLTDLFNMFLEVIRCETFKRYISSVE